MTDCATLFLSFSLGGASMAVFFCCKNTQLPRATGNDIRHATYHIGGEGRCRLAERWVFHSNQVRDVGATARVAQRVRLVRFVAGLAQLNSTLGDIAGRRAGSDGVIMVMMMMRLTGRNRMAGLVRQLVVVLGTARGRLWELPNGAHVRTTSARIDTQFGQVGVVKVENTRNVWHFGTDFGSRTSTYIGCGSLFFIRIHRFKVTLSFCVLSVLHCEGRCRSWYTLALYNTFQSIKQLWSDTEWRLFSTEEPKRRKKKLFFSAATKIDFSKILCSFRLTKCAL